MWPLGAGVKTSLSLSETSLYFTSVRRRDGEGGPLVRDLVRILGRDLVRDLGRDLVRDLGRDLCQLSGQNEIRSY